MRKQNTMEVAFAPRWTWRTLVLSAGVTALLYLVLPSLELLSHPPEKTLEVRKVQTVELPPPPPPVERPKPKPRQTKPTPPKPRMQQARRTLSPLQGIMNLSMIMGDVGGDFSTSFGLSDTKLSNQLGELIFELSDLDEKPRALNKLKPIYPPQAKMRRIEGHVVIDFVVGENGRARSIEVVSEQPTSIFTEAAKNAIARWRFTPGTKGGKTVSARVRQKVIFSLN